MSIQVLGRPDPGFRLTGRKVLLIFVLFFGTIATADGILLTSALRTWSGLEERSPYQAGQRYNAEIRTARAQEERGWALDMRTERRGASGLLFEATFRDKAGAPLAGLAPQLLLERPIDKRLDVQAALVEVAPGLYRAELAAVPAGQWDVVLDVAEAETRVFRRRARLKLR